MRLTLRMYMQHDFDLLMLHKTGKLHIGKAAKKALIACYTGKPIVLDTTADAKETNYIPKMLQLGVAISERDEDKYPGITDWVEGFTLGYRNVLLKSLVRAYLDKPAVWALRTDGWENTILPHTDANKAVIPSETSSYNKKAEPISGSQWIDEISARPLTSSQTDLTKIKDDTALDDLIGDDDFDPFDDIISMKGGD